MPLNILEDASAGDSDLDKLAPNELGHRIKGTEHEGN